MILKKSRSKVKTALKAIPQQCCKNVSNSGNIVGLSAQLFKGSTSNVTPLRKLQVYRYACS